MNTHGQNGKNAKLTEDKNWIEKMNDKIGVDISVNNSFLTFSVSTPTNKTVLYPNTPNNLLLRFNYDFISIDIEFSPSFLPGNGDEALRGSTNSYEIGASLIFKHWFTSVTFKNIKGFYLENTADYDSTWKPGDPYLQIPDLRYKGLRVLAGYIHNPNFSLRSLTSHTERQVKSAGSFIPILETSYYVIDNETGTIGTQRSANYEIAIGPGYHYTFVFKERFYSSLAITGSLGYLNTKLTTRAAIGNLISNQNNFVVRGNYRVSIGYNGKRFYTGMYTNISDARFRQEGSTARNSESRIFYHFFLGMRLDAPKFLQKGMQKVKGIF